MSNSKLPLNLVQQVSNSDDAAMADNINNNAEDRLHLHTKTTQVHLSSITISLI